MENEKLSTTALLSALVKLSWHDGRYTIEECRHLPIFLVFKGVEGARIDKAVKEHASTHRSYATVTESGWINETSFKEWIHLLPAIAADQTWIVMDVFYAHRTDAVLQLLRRKGIQPFFIPAGRTSLAQVHDTHINRPFKAAFEVQYAKFVLGSNRGERMSRERVIDYSFLALQDVKAATLKHGFEKNVLGPLCPNAELGPEVHVVTDEPLVEEQGDAELALAMNHFEIEQEEEGADEDEAEDKPEDRCCFCHGYGGLRKCNQPACTVSFHHYCSAEWNGEEGSDYCEKHAP